MKLRNNLKKSYKCCKGSKIYEYNKKAYNVKEKGVTMLSLVVTIVILLILSGITIKFALDDNGIIKQSSLASEKYKNSQIQEQIALNQAVNEMRKTTSSSGSSSEGGSSSDEDIEDLMQQIETLQNQVDSLNGQIDDLKSKKATGTATAEQVLEGAIFSTSNAIGLTGTMKNNGAWTSSSSGNGKITIPLGYHNGKGYVDLSGTYNEAYSKGVTDADNRVNTNSASYKNGYSTGQSVKKCTKIGTIAANNSSGSGSLNVASILSNYASLSVNNFLLVPTNVSLSFLGGRHNDGQWHGATSGITKSYSGGTLSVSGSATIGNGDNFAWISAYDVYYVN